MPLTAPEFVEKAQSVHGDRYDYTQSTCRLLTDRIQIVCREHGPFWQKAHMHLSGQGCPRCAIELRRTARAHTPQSFAERARDVHGDKYDYSKVVYKQNKTPVEVVCSEHGSFWVKPNHHLCSGVGCPRCSSYQRTTLQDFIEKAKAVHGDKYDYSEVIYKGVRSKVKIICPDHGPFWQTAVDHTSGHRCSFCAGRNRTSSEEVIPRPEVTQQEFIRRATEAHGDRYDYSETVYLGSKKPVSIRCRVHGVFDQMPGNHIGNRAGCPKCAPKYIGGNEEYIRRARLRHGDRYDYSKVNYTDARGKVTIGCKIHGDFEQTATDHIRGYGCRSCGSSKGEETIAKILDKHGVEYKREYRLPETMTRYRYDFYLPQTRQLVEFHGDQHYNAYDYFGGQEGLQKIQLRDKLKRVQAKAAGYQYLEISHHVYSTLCEEDFEKKLMTAIDKARQKLIMRSALTPKTR